MVNYFGEKTIPFLIQQQAQQLPNQVAIQHHATKICYSDLILASDQLAACFLSKGYKAHEIVAVAMDRSIEMSICLLALLKAEITYVPIDPTLPVDRISFLMEDSGARTIITSNFYSETYNAFPLLLFDELWSVRTQYQYVPKTFSLAHIVYIIYTSGSTGLPKGVGISHQSLLNLLLHRLKEPGVTPTDNMLGLTTMSFDISEEELYLPLIAGAKLTIVDQDVVRDGFALLEIVKKEKITLMQATPYIWQMMIEAGWKEKLPIVAFCGGEALTKQLAEQLLTRCKALWNMYGPTETTICALAKQLNSDDEIISIGKPITNTEIYILDESLNAVDKGTEGELYIGGLGVANGYINRPDLTAEKFIPNPFLKPAQLMYATGDLVKQLPNGDLQFIGRKDTQVKIRGYRIETEEIDFQLKAQPLVKDALVMVHQDKVENARLVAYYTLKDPQNQLPATDIEALLKENLGKLLPAYMVPVDYVILPHMPLLPSGKIDRKSLPKPVIKNNTSNYVAPSTPNEEIVAKIWMNNIGINKIGINDDFFELGGTSLIALKTKIQIEKKLAKRLSPSILFKYPTIKQLVNAIENNAAEEFKSLIPIQPNGDKVPLYMVHGIGLNVLGYRSMVAQLKADQPVYGLQAFDDENEKTIYNSIESIAEFYNSEVLKHNPTGPYAIGGYSIGGIIAFEMVKQLKAKGKNVELLAMFDTNVQIPTHQFQFGKKLAVKSLRQLQKLKFRLKSIKKAPTKNINYLIQSNIDGLRKLINKQTDFPNYPKYMLVLMKEIMNAFYRYKLEPIPIKIDVFKADNLYFIDDPKFLGWNDYALEGVNVYDVPGNHAEIFKAPHDKELALKLQNRLDEINVN